MITFLIISIIWFLLGQLMIIILLDGDLNEYSRILKSKNKNFKEVTFYLILVGPLGILNQIVYSIFYKFFKK